MHLIWNNCPIFALYNVKSKNYNTMRKILLLTMMAILALTASAYNFMVDGIAYNYLNGQSGSEVEVTYNNSTNDFTYNYRSLTTANIPSSVTYNGTTYSVTSIGKSTFSYCSGLTSVTIPNSVTSIGNSAFSNCSGLTSVTIPNSVTSIGEGAFYGCSGLTSVTIGNSVTLIGYGAFDGCSGLTSVTIGNSVTSIGGSAFERCSGLTSVDIPNSVTSIDNWAFYNCSGLTSVTIPNSVTSIGHDAFYNCNGLTSVTIPNSVTSVDYYAFYGCSGLTEIRSKIVNVGNVSMGDNVFYNVPTSTCKLKVPVGTANAYRNANQWSVFSNIKETLFSSGTVGDLNEDNAVDGSDINIMVNQLLKITDCEAEDDITDLNGDEKVNGIDLHEMINIILGQ